MVFVSDWLKVSEIFMSYSSWAEEISLSEFEGESIISIELLKSTGAGGGGGLKIKWWGGIYLSVIL